MKRRAAGTALIVLGLLWTVGATTSATFSDRAQSTGNTAGAGTLFMSVDGQCGSRPSGGGGAGGPGSDGNTGCSLPAAFTANGLIPGGAGASHTYTIVNEGTLAGDLSGSANVTVDAGHAGCAGTNFTVIAGPPSATTLAAGATATFPVSVALAAAAPNACQGASAEVTVTFDLVQA